MKVLVNVSRELLDPLGPDWVECEGFKLMEADDGSFDLVVTRDLAAFREQRARAIKAARDA